MAVRVIAPGQRGRCLYHCVQFTRSGPRRSWNWELLVTSFHAPHCKFFPRGDLGTLSLYLPRSGSTCTHSTNILCQARFWCPRHSRVGTKPLSFSLMKPCDLTFCSTRGNILLLIVTGLLSCVRNEDSRPQSYTPCSMALTVLLLTSFTEIELTYCSIHLFKVYNSVVCGRFTDLCNHHHNRF